METLALMRDAASDPPRGVMNHLLVMRTESQMLGDQPFLISTLVTQAIERLLLDDIDRALALDALTPQELPEVQTLLLELDPMTSLQWGIRGECAGFIQAGNYVRSGGAISMPAPAHPLPIPFLHGNWLRDFAAGITLTNEILAAVQDPRQLLAATAHVDVELNALPSYYIYTRSVIPSQRRAVELTLRVQAQIHAAVMGLGASAIGLPRGVSRPLWPR